MWYGLLAVVFWAVVAVLLGGCTSLRPEAEAVRIVGSDEALKDASFVNSQYYYSEASADELATRARNFAADQHADLVIIRRQKGNSITNVGNVVTIEAWKSKKPA